MKMKMYPNVTIMCHDKYQSEVEHWFESPLVYQLSS